MEEGLSMFRPIRKKKNEIDKELSIKLLQNERRAVFSVNGDNGYPYCIPINYLYVEEEGKIYFHGSKAGHKVDSLKKSDKICLTVFGNEQIKSEPWAPYMQSVVLFGRCRLIEDKEQTLDLAKRFAMKYYPSEEMVDAEISEYGKAVQMFEITIEYLSGKEIQER